VISHVLVAVDNTRESLHAARTAAGLAVGWGVSVRVITVVQDSKVAEQIWEIAGPDAMAPHEDQAARLVAHGRDEVCQAGIPATSVDTVVRSGEPFRRILDEARE
jgi:nucleotide-binding universal stress UspA family protein